MKTKNRGIITATVALLMLMAMFVTGCDSGGIPVEKPYTPPPGMGAIKLNLNNKIARTILPEHVTDASDFDHFDLIFTPSGGTALPTKHIPQGDEGDPIPLAFGSYSLTVLAYLNSSDATEAASWQSNPTGGYSINIANTTPVPVNVDLRGNVDSGTGFFAWDIDITTYLTEDIDIVDMTVTKIGGGFDTIYDLLMGTGTGTAIGSDNTLGLQDSLELNSGYYTVTFKLSVNSTEINFQQILHIYAKMTSLFEYELKNSYFGITSGSIVMNIDYANRGTVITLTSKLNGDPVSPLIEKDIVGPLEIGTDTAVITVSNPVTAAFPVGTAISWHCSDSAMILDTSTTTRTDDTLTITPTTTATEFDVAKTYIISVTATNAAGEPSSIYFYVEVVDP